MRFVIGGADGTVRLWNRDGQALGEPFQRHQGNVLSVGLTPDGQTIVSGGDDGTVRLWQGNWQGWLKLACTQLQEHSVFRDPDHSFDPEAAKAARQTCEEMVWNRMNYGSR